MRISCVYFVSALFATLMMTSLTHAQELRPRTRLQIIMDTILDGMGNMASRVMPQSGFFSGPSRFRRPLPPTGFQPQPQQGFNPNSPAANEINTDSARQEGNGAPNSPHQLAQQSQDHSAPHSRQPAFRPRPQFRPSAGVNLRRMMNRAMERVRNIFPNNRRRYYTGRSSYEKSELQQQQEQQQQEQHQQQ